MLTLRTIFSCNLCRQVTHGQANVLAKKWHANVESMSSEAQNALHGEVQSRVHSRSRSSAPARARRRFVSKLYQNFGKLQPQELGTCQSYKLMLYNEVIGACYPGAFHLLPWGQRAMEKLIRVIDQEMDAVGGQKISMPTLAPDTYWRPTGRWESTGKELFKLQDREGNEFCLGPTHEELITSLVASQCPLSSHQLPQMLYQITRKFRDEMSPKHGLLRGREFEMKDMYTFDTNEETAMDTYHIICDAYDKVFDRIGVPYEKVEGATGNIGGSLSHEFHYLADVGEDRVLLCSKCGLQMNKELTEDKTKEEICRGDKDSCQLTESKGIEVGHCFYLGTKYSSVFNATYTDDADITKPIHMGCFGLGVTRILQASVEVLSKERRLCWPSVLAPYQVCIIPQKEGYQADQYFRLAEEVSDELCSMPHLASEVVIDDRVKFSIGRRIYEASRLGYPYIVVVGKKALSQPCQLEVITAGDGETRFMSRDQLRDLMSTVVTV
ncbi:putative proline--tRNA ligase, mitochondrial [Babylonia areolata]|uniref:putative proline--tRNA ligase, mitochondrial n=1 Tax=Babylonia areolata TaxID=304850 RepID=UPI003FCFDCAC